MGLPFSLIKEEKKPSVLVVDDVSANLELMEAVFQRAGYTVHMASGANPAIDIFNNYSIDIAILDVMMPGINGFELCSKLKNLTDKFFFPVILLTALNDKKSRITGIECGADDFISKPFDVLELLTKVKSLLKLKELHEELDHSENIIFSLIIAMEANDYYTKGHSTRVGDLAKEFGSFLGFPEKELEILKKAGILHDIGKIGFSEKILRKPAGLTEEETKIIRKHPLIGESICRPLLSMQSVLPAIRSHHERWDGNGYPDMLRGDDIPLMARILAILDSYDAMASIRPYRDKRTTDYVLSVIAKEQYDGQWDPELTGLFLQMVSSAAIAGEGLA
jgi:putative two-component system response regulator